MNSCMRCGEKMAHNYLVAMYTIIKEKRERMRVCLKCKEILNKKGEEKEVEVSKEENKKDVPKEENKKKVS